MYIAKTHVTTFDIAVISIRSVQDNIVKQPILTIHDHSSVLPDLTVVLYILQPLIVLEYFVRIVITTVTVLTRQHSVTAVIPTSVPKRL